LKKAKPFNFLDALEKYKSVGIVMIYGVSRWRQATLWELQKRTVWLCKMYEDAHFEWLRKTFYHMNREYIKKTTFLRSFGNGFHPHVSAG
jgi:hypothetical protein